jgi:hypothetical protein
MNNTKAIPVNGMAFFFFPCDGHDGYYDRNGTVSAFDVSGPANPDALI